MANPSEITQIISVGSFFREGWIFSKRRLSSIRAFNSQTLTVSHCQNKPPQDWPLYYDIKKRSQRECRKTFNTYVSNLVDLENNCTTKKLWPFIKSKKQD